MSSSATSVVVNPSRSRVARGNAILSAITGDYHDRGFETPLTLKSVIRGKALYSTRKSRYLVEPGTVAVLDRGSTYDLDIDRTWECETLALFFDPAFAARAMREATASEGNLLETNECADGESAHYCERLHPLDGELHRSLVRIHRSIHSGETDALEEQFVRIAVELARLQLGVRREIDRFPARRAATREELYRRLHYARDYIHSAFADALTLEDIAMMASLSPYHFLRSFRATFGMTPMEYLRSRRLDVAGEMLSRTDTPVTEVCFAVGFESLGSFSSLFSKRFGRSPRAWRTAHDAKKRSTPN